MDGNIKKTAEEAKAMPNQVGDVVKEAPAHTDDQVKKPDTTPSPEAEPKKDRPEKNGDFPYGIFAGLFMLIFGAGLFATGYTFGGNQSEDLVRTEVVENVVEKTNTVYLDTPSCTISPATVLQDDLPENTLELIATPSQELGWQPISYEFDVSGTPLAASESSGLRLDVSNSGEYLVTAKLNPPEATDGQASVEPVSCTYGPIIVDRSPV